MKNRGYIRAVVNNSKGRVRVMKASLEETKDLRKHQDRLPVTHYYLSDSGRPIYCHQVRPGLYLGMCVDQETWMPLPIHMPDYYLKPVSMPLEETD
jgi:hypothetical protein